jgi:hypothetical protein
MLILLSWLAPALAGPSPLQLHVDPVDVPAVVEVSLDSLLWVNVSHPSGAAEAVAEVLGDDLVHCDDLRSATGFKPRHADDLWKRDLLRYAIIEVSATSISVGGQRVLDLVGGDTPDSAKRGVVLVPVLDALLAQAEAQYQFRVACNDPEWVPGGAATSASNQAVLLAVAPDVPFDVVHEILLTARKARFKYFYLYASGRNVVADPHARPPTLGDNGLSVYVASDGGLGIDSQEEGRDTASLLLDYLPRPAGTRSGRVVPYQASPFSRVVGAAGALLAKGWEPAVLSRLDSEDLRAVRSAPTSRSVDRSISGRRSVTAVPITLPEGDVTVSEVREKRTRFVITGNTPHVAIFTPPAHLADALNTPDVGASLKHVLTCYRDEEADTEGLSGELVFEILVQPSGQVSKVSLLPTSSLQDLHLRRCATDAFTALHFPSYAVTPEPMLWKVLFLPGPPGGAEGEH